MFDAYAHPDTDADPHSDSNPHPATPVMPVYAQPVPASASPG